jgi:hypothetical protein
MFGAPITLSPSNANLPERLNRQGVTRSRDTVCDNVATFNHHQISQFDMAFVTITEAAALVRRSRRTLYRDIEKGRLSKTVAHDGTTTIDTSELLRVYGNLHKADRTAAHASGNSPVDEFEELVETWEHPQHPMPKGNSSSEDRAQLHILEEKIKALEHVLALESTLRKVKDEVTSELRARLEEKERIIKMLENKVLLLDYNGEPTDNYFPRKPKGLFAKLFNMK